MSQSNLNPYASPRGVESSPPDAREKALWFVRIPAVGLIVLSTIVLVAAAYFAVAMLILAASGHWTFFYGEFPAALLHILAAIPSGYILRGAMRMRRGLGYSLALSTTILACIPFLTPLVFFGIPFGIWALVVLQRSDVRAAFHDANTEAIP